MLAWIKTNWEAFKARRKLVRETRPETIRALAGELAELAEIASRVMPEEHEIQVKTQRIRREMAELTLMTNRPEFKLLPPARRQELRESLLLSREQLLRAVSDAPTPTMMRQ